MLRFVIITPGRSGSSYLVDILNHHPQIDCRQELFNRSNYSEDSFNGYCLGKTAAFVFNRERLSKNPINFPLQLLISAYLSKIEGDGFGFKISLDQLEAYPQLVKILKKRHYKIIYLTRKDKLRLAVSMLKAKMTQNFDGYDERKIYIDPAMVKKEMLHIASMEARYQKQQLGGLVLDFERLSDSFDRIIAHLKIAEFTFQWNASGRLNPESMANWVQNWAEIKAMITESGE